MTSHLLLLLLLLLGVCSSPQVLPDNYSIEDTALFYARAAAANWDAQLVGWRIKYTTLHW
jgi:hypothetical protein